MFFPWRLLRLLIVSVVLLFLYRCSCKGLPNVLTELTEFWAWLNLRLASYLPISWTRVHHWVFLLSDQNLQLYGPTDLLLSPSAFYLVFFLDKLHAAATRDNPSAENPLVRKGLLIPYTFFVWAHWALSAVLYIKLQQGVLGMILALFDLIIEELMIAFVVHIALYVVAWLTSSYYW